MSKIDAEIKKIITVAYNQAVEIVKSKKSLMDKVAAVLIKKESIDQDEFEKIVGKKYANTTTHWRKRNHAPRLPRSSPF